MARRGLTLGALLLCVFVSFAAAQRPARPGLSTGSGPIINTAQRKSGDEGDLQSAQSSYSPWASNGFSSSSNPFLNYAFPQSHQNYVPWVEPSSAAWPSQSPWAGQPSWAPSPAPAPEYQQPNEIKTDIGDATKNKQSRPKRSILNRIAAAVAKRQNARRNWNQSQRRAKANNNPSQPAATCGVFRGVCQKSRYRTYDGSCNNLQTPSLGMANTRYSRLRPANYADNVHAPPVAKSGNPLPNPRLLSFTLFPDVDIQNRKWTLVNMQWGQLMTHDMALIDGTTQSTAHATRCCTPDGQLIESALDSPLCFPILIPANDPVYSYERQQCRNFVRSTTDLDRGCSSGYSPAEQLTVVSHFLDLSVIYGSSDSVAAGLRARVGGRLIVDVRGNREWLPQASNKSICDVQSNNDVCYTSGDARVNQNPQLTILHLMMHREHNRIAGALAKLNPHWSDETTFQEARRINIAQYQQVSYYEWLPIFLGAQKVLDRRITYKTKGWVNDYEPNIDPSTINEHSTAAFRYFHSLIAGRLLLVDEQRYAYSYNALRLSDHFNRPGVIEEDGNLDKLTRGMSFQPQEETDEFFDKEITNYLFRNRNRLGGDLRAIDIQRDRDHGLERYNEYRVLAGLPRATQWSDFGDFIAPQNIQKLSQLYERPADVDLSVGGSLEAHIVGTNLVGPTFLNILSEQFWRTRVGDRFWFETGDPELAFTIEQLAEIRKASIARLMCDNGDNIQLMQLHGFEQVSLTNPLLRCADIPAINLNLWRDIQSQAQDAWAPSPWS